MSAAITRCARGDKLALRVIFDLEASRMLGVAVRILRRKELAEDVLQDAFVRIWRGASQFDPARGAALSWLYAIVRHRALTAARHERRFEAEEWTDGFDVAVDTAVDRLPDRSALRRCLGQMEADRRAAVVLAYVHGFSHAELAKRLGAPLGTVKSWTRRGLLSLRECLG